MHLIYVYGPPAVGKLTVSREIVKRTGIPLFHNHLSVSVSEALFRFGSHEYYDLLDNLRLNVIVSAARIGLAALIFTNAYTFRKNYNFVQQLNSSLLSVGSKITYIQLTCSSENLFRRVVGPERSLLGKINQIDHLVLEMARDNYSSKIPFTPHFTYDTDDRSATTIAELIIQDIDL
jgi:hypothetical protein